MFFGIHSYNAYDNGFSKTNELINFVYVKTKNSFTRKSDIHR